MATKKQLTNRFQSDIDLCNNQIKNAAFEYWDKTVLPEDNLFNGRLMFILKNITIPIEGGKTYTYDKGSLIICNVDEEGEFFWVKILSSLQTEDVSGAIKELWKEKTGRVHAFDTKADMEASKPLAWEMDLAIVSKDESTEHKDCTLYVAVGTSTTETTPCDHWAFVSTIGNSNVPTAVTELGNGRSIISNEITDNGACLKFEGTSGDKSGISVHNGVSPAGTLGEIYAVDGSKKGARLNVTKSGIFYSNATTEVTVNTDAELTVVGDIIDKPSCEVAGTAAEALIGTVVWGQIGGTLANQIDLTNTLNGKENTLLAGDNIVIDRVTTPGKTIIKSTGGGGGTAAEWGKISGTLANQADLVAEFAKKEDYLVAGANITITRAGGQTTISATGGPGGATWGSISGTITDQTDLINKIDSSVNAETTRATAAEIANTTAITNEVSRAQAAEAANTTAITNEVSRAQAAEAANATAITDENARAVAKENALESGKLKTMLNSPDGTPYKLPYFFKTEPSATGVKVIAETITLDNLDVKQPFDLTVEGATSSTAGLMTAADKVNLDATKVKVDGLISDTESGKTDKTYSQSKIDQMVQSGGVYRGNFPTYADLVGTTIAGLAVNDTAIVLDDETRGHKTDVYKWDGSAWKYMYDINTSTFTTEQWDAINSGITATKVTNMTNQINAHTTKLNDLKTADIKDFASAVKAAILDTVYPIGALYISTSSTNPSTLFGGTWQSYAEGRTLIGVGTKYTAGATGGSEEVTLTTDQMPSHNHGASNHTHAAACGDWGGDSHLSGIREIGLFDGADGQFQLGEWEPHRVESASGKEGSGNITLHLAHNHAVTVAEGGVTISPNGSSKAHNNMMPYIVTYIFRRTA